MFSTKSGISARSCSALASSLPMSLSAQQRTNTENSKHILPEKELRGHSPNFHIHVSVITINLPIAHRHMDIEIVTEAAQFPEMAYMIRIFLAV
jgi:hypothetical protein